MWFQFVLLNSQKYSKFWWFCGDLVHEESHSQSTESTQSQTFSQLSQRRVRLSVNWVNFRMIKTLNTSVSSKINKWINIILTVRCLSWHGVSLSVDSVNVESHSMLAQLTGSLTPCWLSWQGVSLHVGSVDRESHSVLAQLTGSLTLCGLSVRKINRSMRSKTGKT